MNHPETTEGNLGRFAVHPNDATPDGHPPVVHDLDATDLFSGCGGLSLGATWAGVNVTLAINHWAPAVEAHQKNHPGTRHERSDLTATSPAAYPRTELLLASPSCTGHSRSMNRTVARPSNPAAHAAMLERAEERMRSRAHPWIVCEWAEHHRPSVVIVENVIELSKWAPFTAWLAAMTSLGYDHQVLSLNAAVFTHCGLGVPQSRDRLYIVFSRRGLNIIGLDPDVDALCAACGPVRAHKVWRNGRQFGAHGAQYDYRCACGAVAHPYVPPAANIIDTANTGRGVAGRTLAAATMTRLDVSLRRWQTGQLHQGPWAATNDVANTQHMWISKQFGGNRGQAITKPLGAITAMDHHMLVVAPPDRAPARVRVRDLSVRMLTPTELTAGMGFPGNYQLVGDIRTRIRLLGNAVPPQVMAHVVGRAVAALGA